MASSELINTLSTVESYRQLSSRYRPAPRNIYTQLLTDVMTIAIALGSATRLPSVTITFPFPHHGYLSAVAASLMITTVFAIAGAYPRYRTPLDIAETAGLVRGISCGTILFAMIYISQQKVPGIYAIWLAVLVIFLLLLRREVTQLLVRSYRARRSLLYPAGSVDCQELARPIAHSPHAPVQSRADDVLKRMIDFGSSTLLLLLFSPVFLCVAFLIYVDSPGPIFIRQRRVGRNGAPFYIWKFRSMYRGVGRYQLSPTTDTDPRLTRVGRILRRLSLDELPQLINVLKGEMSLVGPRPEMPFIVDHYDSYQRLRLNATPGITGLWQISPARALPIHVNVELDLFYIGHRDMFLDIAILLRTVAAVIQGIGAT